jgi:alanyl-tRNA synthetase
MSASHRVIADHLRSSAFLIADGVLPSNEGRGYVLRRIMRRAMRHAQLLGAKDPLMWKLVPALVREMGQAYPELVRGRGADRRNAEARGNPLPQDAGARPRPVDHATRRSAGRHADGETAFKLYDTYGFPLDLTQDALRQREIGVDIEGFDAAMERQKAEARAAWAGSGEAATETIWFPLREKRRRDRIPRLRYRDGRRRRHRDLVKDGNRSTSRRCRGRDGRDRRQPDAVLWRIRRPGGRYRHDLRRRLRGEVTDTQKKGDGVFVHSGKVVSGTIALGAPVELTVDHARRTKIRANHSATHLLHEALREVLGTHVAQKGSLVAPERLRFDFRTPSRSRARSWRRSRRWRTKSCCRTSRSPRADGGRRRDRRGRHGAVRREVWRRGSRRVDGHRPAWRQGQPGLFGRALRRHACFGTGDIGLVRIVSEAPSPPACAASRR